tara:strand:- start:148 stop:513 length:366 start_codon:yes stop_codon:yes gene_type:complete
MANELTVTVSLAFDKGGVAASKAFTDVQFDVSGAKLAWVVQNIGTGADVALKLGDMTTPGYMLVKNLDDTNYVTIGGAASLATQTIRLNAGEVALFRHMGTAPVASADTAACNIEYLLIED